MAQNGNEPTFHRKANSRTQTFRTAVKQNKSRELWGRGFLGGVPSVIAYLGEMDHDQQGTEFTTSVPYAKNGDPVWAYWYLPEFGGDENVREVEVNNQTYACLDIEPKINRYDCK